MTARWKHPVVRESGEAAADRVAGGAVVVVALARVGRLHRPRAPLLESTVRRLFRLDAAAEHEVARRAGDGDGARAVLMTHFVVDDVRRARRHAPHSVPVVAQAALAVLERIVERIFLVAFRVYGVTSKHLYDTKQPFIVVSV